MPDLCRYVGANEHRAEMTYFQQINNSFQTIWDTIIIFHSKSDDLSLPSHSGRVHSTHIYKYTERLRPFSYYADDTQLYLHNVGSFRAFGWICQPVVAVISNQLQPLQHPAG